MTPREKWAARVAAVTAADEISLSAAVAFLTDSSHKNPATFATESGEPVLRWHGAGALELRGEAAILAQYRSSLAVSRLNLPRY